MGQPGSPQDWKVLYAAAMLESDNTQVWHRIEAADAAMQARLNRLSAPHPQALSNRG